MDAVEFVYIEKEKFDRLLKSVHTLESKVADSQQSKTMSHSATQTDAALHPPPALDAPAETGVTQSKKKKTGSVARLEVGKPIKTSTNQARAKGRNIQRDDVARKLGVTVKQGTTSTSRISKKKYRNSNSGLASKWLRLS